MKEEAKEHAAFKAKVKKPLAPKMPGGLLSIDELAAKLNCSPRSVMRLLKSKAIPSLKIGRLTRIAPTDADFFVASQVSR